MKLYKTHDKKGVRHEKAYFMDVDSMNEQVLDYVMEKKA